MTQHHIWPFKCHFLQSVLIFLFLLNLHFRLSGADIRELSKPAGETFNLEEIGAALTKHKPSLFFVTHAESSTGGLQGLEGIGALAAR